MRTEVEHHLARPAVSAAQYFRRLTAALGETMSHAKRVYLDSNYWIHLRDAALGRPRKQSHSKLLEVLRTHVAQGSILCPVSDVAYVELMQQANGVTRRATASVWDELSRGCALQSEQTRVMFELENFFRNPSGGPAREALRTLTLVRPCFVLGPVVPTSSGVPPELNRAIQKVVMDRLWKMSFSELTEDSELDELMAERFNATAANINREMRRPENQATHFTQALSAEVSGAVDAVSDAVQAALANLSAEQRPGGKAPCEEVANGARLLANAVKNGIRLKPKLTVPMLPTVYLSAACHASIRMDANRKFNGNFLRDLHHGMAGVAYHDLMLTERPLAVLLNSGRVKATEFGCRVVSDDEEALSALSDLTG
jgi:hypothetical protein